MGKGYRAGLGSRTRVGHMRGTYEGSQLARLAKYLSLPGIAGNDASTPDSAAFALAGDVDIRAKVSSTFWNSGAAAHQTILAKGIWEGAIDSSFGVNILSNGRIAFPHAFAAGAFSNPNSTDIIPIANTETGSVKVTRTIADGTIRWWYRVGDGDPWTEFGVPVVSGAGTPLHHDPNPLLIGNYNNAQIQPFFGEVYSVEIRDGIDGTIISKFDPTRSLTNQTQIQAETGEVWTINTSGGGQIAQLF